MKWWGWGEENVSFTHEGKPELAPFIERVLGLDVRRPGTSAIAFEDLEIPAAALPTGLRADLEDAVGAEQVSTDDRDRVVHGRGKSLTVGAWGVVYRYLGWMRGGVKRVADMVCLPSAFVVLCVASSLVASGVSPGAARAAFPGANGQIAYGCFAAISWVCVANPDASGGRRLAEGHQPDWSPDGKQILFTRYEDAEPPQIFVMNADGSA